MDDIYDINGYTDEELYAVLDLSNPTDRELEAKILHMIWKYENFGNASGDRLVRFFNDIYAHFFETTVKEGMENQESIPDPPPAPAPAPAPAPTQEVVPAGTSYSSDKLNPVFRQTINRIVNIDSQYRNKSAITTDYTFNLSSPLKDVVSLKLNSVQIPYTWYTINANYGSNFLYLKGISPGVTGGDYDIKVQINPGNYTANALVTAVNDSFVALRTNANYSDISFGITGITYDYPSSKSTINIDLKKVYNETDYTFDFGTWSTPNVGANTANRGNSIASFLGYNFPSYTPNIVRSRYDILPLIANSSADNAISQFALTTNNNYFNIINYTGTEYITDPSGCTVLDNIKITLSLTTGLTYSRSQIVTDLSDQLANNTKLTNSYINRYDYTEPTNTGFIGYNKSYYELYVELNRFNTSRVNGAKVAIVFSDNTIWYGATSAFVFEKNSYELSNITSESKAPQASIVINSPLNNPSHIYLKCKIPRFNGRTDTGNVITGGNTIINDFKIPIANSPAGGYTFNNYLKQINDQIFDASNNGNINTTNTLLSVEDSYSKIKVDVNKRFRENAYILDRTSSSFITTIGFSSGTDLDLDFNSISGTPYTSATYSISQGATIMIIKPKTLGANKDINNYVVTNNTGQSILTTSTSEISGLMSSIFASFVDEYGDNVLSGSTLTFATQQNDTVATLRVIINKYLIEQFYDIQFVDPNANALTSRIVGCGIGTDTSGNTYGALSYSDDYGTTWSGTTSTIFSTKANASAYNGNTWIAAGQGAGNTLAASMNGSTWTGLGKSIFSIEATGIAWNGSMWIATGQGGNTLARSTNGTTWTGLGSTTFTVKATGIAWNGNVWAATGEGGNTIAISQDGINWTSRATTSLFSTRATGIAWNGYIWVATGHGTNTIAYSKNIMGNTWTPAATTSLFSTGANGVVWNDSVPMWVAVGEGSVNTLATSYDGNIWTPRGNTTFTTAGYGVSLTGENPPKYIAVGEGGNVIVRSTNGITWTTLTTSPFTTGHGIGWDTKTIGQNTPMITDTANSWVQNLKLEKSKYDLSDYRTAFSWAQISGVGLVSTDVITITNSTAMNTIKLTPVTTGLTTGTNSYSNGIIITIPNGTYTRDQLITAINYAFTSTLTGVNSQNIASGSIAKVITTATGDEFIQIRLNVNKIYTSADYKLVFYDPYSFSTILTSGIINGGRNIGNTSWDSTLGWILGFHEETEYDLSTTTFVLTSGNVKSIIGDNVVSINIYSYFMILLDDFNNSHMNDGIVTTTKKETDIKLPGYTNRTNFNADPITGNLVATSLSANGAPLTQKQVYAIQATLDQQTTQTSALKFTEGPFATNVFGLLPLNIANLPNNSIYVDSSIGLRDQQRNYFGPVNIQRMSVKLINDRGETVDLNGANWSFSFICEQLYQNNRA